MPRGRPSVISRGPNAMPRGQAGAARSSTRQLGTDEVSRFTQARASRITPATMLAVTGVMNRGEMLASTGGSARWLAMP